MYEKPNFFLVPHKLVDKWLRKMTHSELKYFLYEMRGEHKFDYMEEKLNMTAAEGCETYWDLIEKGYLKDEEKEWVDEQE